MSFSEWRKMQLDNICTFFNGKKRPNTEGYIPVYGGNGILDYCGEANTDGESVIIGRVGAYCGNVKYNLGKCWISDNAILVKATENMHSKFLYYKFNSLSLGNFREGSTQPLLTQTTLKKISTNIPPLQEQKAIANILSSLDEKIELNNQMNKTLEEMAQALFKRWFVDFEFPNEDGESYKSSGGEMVDSELGMIPKGWKVGVLSDIADIIMGQSPKGSSYNELGEGEVFFQGRAEFGTRFPKPRLFTTEPKRMANKNDILMSVRAPVGDLNIAHEKCCIGRGLAAIQSKMVDNSFVLYTMFNLKQQLDVFNREGTVFGSINKAGLNNLKIIVPIKDIIDRFDRIVTKIDGAIKNNYDEICSLVEIRDTLLPKLMSGEIRVSDIEN